jgi:hypothetical protein
VVSPSRSTLASTDNQFDLMSVPVIDSFPFLRLEQEVGKHWQGLPAFHHADNLAQRLQKDFSRDAEFHGRIPISNYL